MRSFKCHNLYEAFLNTYFSLISPFSNHLLYLMSMTDSILHVYLGNEDRRVNLLLRCPQPSQEVTQIYRKYLYYMLRTSYGRIKKWLLIQFAVL